MTSAGTWRGQAPVLLASGAAIAGFASIALSHLLLGAAVAWLLVARRELLRLPPVWLPAAVFLAWTLVSLFASEDPQAGLPQVRKFYVWLVLVVVFSALRNAEQVRWLFVAIVAVGTASAVWSMVEFWQKYSHAMQTGKDFYQAYVADRITGFMSHWMTFAAQMMMGTLLLASFVFYDRRGIRWTVVAPAALLLGLALVLGFTRSIWPATAAGLLYLVWFWRRWMIVAMIVAAPVLGLVGILAGPEFVQMRIRSVWAPDPKLDSNADRVAMRSTGIRMIQAHPVLGVGPEHVERNFVKHMPDDLAKPPWVGHLHNIYLQFAAERGVPALLAMLWLLGKALVDFRAALRRLRPEEATRRCVLHAAVACMIGILVGGWWEHNLGDSEVLASVWTVIAGGYVAVKEES